jgi:hypothetical protein
MLRGARSANAIIMAPGYEKGFGFLCGNSFEDGLGGPDDKAVPVSRYRL